MKLDEQSSERQYVSLRKYVIGFGVMVSFILIHEGAELLGTKDAPSSDFDFWLMAMICFLGIFPLKQALAQLKRFVLKESLMETLFEKMHEGVIVCDTEGKILSFNQRVSADMREDYFPSFGQYDNFQDIEWNAYDEAGRKWQIEFPLHRVLVGEELEDQQIWIKPPGKTPILLSVRGKQMTTRCGKLVGAIIIYRDLTEERKDQDQMKHVAWYNTLTDLPNINTFTQSLEKALISARSERTELAVMFVDLGRFQMATDTMGRYFGDLLWKQVSLRLSTCVREGDIVSRAGGDEFLLLLEKTSLDEAEHIADRIIQSLDAPFVVNGQEIVVNPSIGISFAPQDGKCTDELLQKADIALQAAKKQGKRYVRSYSAEMAENLGKRLLLEKDLRKALELEQFELHFQPRIDVKKGEIIGTEALLRWKHPSLGYVSPNEFVPIAEETGLIVAISDWVLKKACAQNKVWQHMGFSKLRVAVNLSVRDFNQKNIDEKIKRTLLETGLESQYLELEITERMTMDKHLAVNRLKKLKNIGVAIAIDDFGTGFSSLSYLKELPVDTIKIDRSFVKEMIDQRNDRSIVKAIISLAKSLGMRVVAEGVESDEQYSVLKNLKCDEAQGYYFGKPLPPKEFARMLNGQASGVPAARLSIDSKEAKKDE